MTKDPNRVEAGRRAYQTYKRNAQARPSTTKAYVAELAAKIRAAAEARQAQQEGTE
jgi:hypothetical protein